MASLVPQLRTLLVLLAALGPGSAATRVLESPPFNCSLQGLHCHVTNSNCIHESWLHPSNFTPSAPSVVDVGYSLSQDEQGHLVPVLEIEWKVATDASILFLKGAELVVLQVAGSQYVCVQFEFENDLAGQRGPDGERWRFVYNRFVVNPGATYEVTVSHLPKLGTNGDQNKKSKMYHVPDCTHPEMKTTWPCQMEGSRWEPNITVDVQQDSHLVVYFNSSDLSTKYRVHVNSFLSGSKVPCKEIYQDVSEVGPDQSVNISIDMKENMKSCCHYEVQIWGFFPSCSNDCSRYSTSVPCPTSPPSTIVPPGPFRRDHWYVTAVCALLVGLSLAGLFCMVLKPVFYFPGPLEYKHLVLSPPKILPPPKVQKVWIVYSADHSLYVEVVLKLADFLRNKCGTAVVLDLLQKRDIEKVGIMPWLTSQKQEIENQSAKIIVLCSRGVQAKWQAMMAADKARVSLRQDRMQPSGDLFTAALNLIMHDFQLPANFGKYIIAYFSDIGTEGDIPEPFKATSKYQLMKDFEEVFFRIQDMEQYEPGRMISVADVTAQNYTQSPSGQRLQKAICKFKEWQELNPDWFKKECLEDVYDNEEEDLDVEVPWDPLLKEGATLKLRPVVNMPDDTGCLFVNLHMQEPDGPVTRLEPMLPSQDYGQAAHQTAIYISDAGMDDLVQKLEPVYSMEFENAARQQLPCQIDVPLPQTSSAMRTDLHLIGDFEHLSLGSNQDSQNWPLPGVGDLSDEQKRNLEQLMHLQLSVLAPFEQQLLNEPCETLDKQRQSQQSDQGYFSETSPLPQEVS